MRIFNVIYLLFLPFVLCSQVRIGAERKELYFPLLEGKRIGVVANQASVMGQVNIVDMLVAEGFSIKAVFSPEHGFRNSVEAGRTVGNSIDTLTGIPVISLYGSKKQPSRADMNGIDLVLFDIQDVGVRFYTYISTLSYMMEACAIHRIPMIVLDRPNPNGFYIDGPVLEKTCSSFVGMHQVPMVYGMTIGEYALMVNGEGWLENAIRCDLRVIEMEGYDRSGRVSLPVRPSPNLPNQMSVELYPSLCLFEGTVVSVGRGTPFPFQVYGHPELRFGTFLFTPESIPGISDHPPYEGKECRGEDLRDYHSRHPGDSGRINLHWLIRAYEELGAQNKFFNDYFDKLAGTQTLREQIIRGVPEEDIRDSWKKDINAFREIRQKYLIYTPGDDK